MKFFKFIFIPAFALFISEYGFAQSSGVSINNNGADPHPSAMLDVSSSTKGTLITRMTATQRDAIVNPAAGLQIFNTTTNCLNMWTGSTWKQSCFDCDFTSPVAGNNGPICQGSTLNLSATTVPGATYQWSGPNGFTSTLQNPSIPDASPGASGSYSVTATVNGCTSQPQNTVATVNSTPVTPLAGNDGPKCVGELLNLTSTTIVGATYSWTGPNGYSTSVQNPIISSAQLVNSGTFTVIATANGCPSAPGSTNVTINAIPATPGSITGASTACENSSGNNYSISAVPNATSYSWSVPSGASITSNTGTSIAVTFGSNSGNISVTANNVCGSSSAASSNFSIILNPVSTFTPLAGKTGDPVSFSPTLSGAGYSWVFTNGNPASGNTEFPVVTWSSPSTYSVSLTVTAGGCSSTTTSGVNITDPIIQTFNYSGIIETFTVPSGVTSMVIEARGAQGGSSGYGTGGNGARMKGTFTVTPGQTFKVLVGQQGTGTANGAGGGGGSFVTLSDNTPVIIAGGGGGAGGYNQSSPASIQWGVDGVTTECGTNGKPNGGEYFIADGVGGCSGNGGTAGQSHRPGGGGGGLYTNGTSYTAAYGGGGNGVGGNAFVNSGTGGMGEGNSSSQAGGFGGGGGGALGGGGGGGYSGGGGGTWTGYSSSNWGHGGGAGGSYNSGTNQTNTAGFQSGSGVIQFTY